MKMSTRLEVLGANFTKVSLGSRLTLWFSYVTLIAFLDSKGEMYHAAHDCNGLKWSGTTRKHLNQIPPGVSLPWKEFEALACSEGA